MEEASGLDRWTSTWEGGREEAREGGMAWHSMGWDGMEWNAMAVFSRAVEGSGLVQKEGSRGEGGGRGRGEPNPRRRGSKIGGIR
jgi:hypothetical protein